MLHCTAAPLNVISDGFYELGQLRDSQQLRSLEEYGKEEVNEHRPVIVINPKPELVDESRTFLNVVKSVTCLC